LHTLDMTQMESVVLDGPCAVAQLARDCRYHQQDATYDAVIGVRLPARRRRPSTVSTAVVTTASPRITAGSRKQLTFPVYSTNLTKLSQVKPVLPIAPSFISELVRELNSEVTQTADTQYRLKIAREGTAVPQRVVGGNSSAKRWCRLHVPQTFRHGRRP
jgi:hypothetical protein